MFITDNPCVAEEAERTKRRWWGNKHKDNKCVAWLNVTRNIRFNFRAYGFWISALNKAGNYKRGKRGGNYYYGLG